jgi:hypothetical protein
VLVPPSPVRLTAAPGPGKTQAITCSQQGMNVRFSSTRPPCMTGGPPADVVEWRTCRLLEHGFPAALAARLARDPVDLHALLELVDRGCPPELAARILAPRDRAG